MKIKTEQEMNKPNNPGRGNKSLCAKQREIGALINSETEVYQRKYHAKRFVKYPIQKFGASLKPNRSIFCSLAK